MPVHSSTDLLRHHALRIDGRQFGSQRDNVRGDACRRLAEERTLCIRTRAEERLGVRLRLDGCIQRCAGELLRVFGDVERGGVLGAFGEGVRFHFENCGLHGRLVSVTATVCISAAIVYGLGAETAIENGGCALSVVIVNHFTKTTK